MRASEKYLLVTSYTRNFLVQLVKFLVCRWIELKFSYSTTCQKGMKVMSGVQVNLCQKHLFLDQLTHNMTKDCSLIYQFSTWKLQAQNMGRTCCVQKLCWMSKQKTICVHNMFSPCTGLVVFMYWTGKSMNNLL